MTQTPRTTRRRQAADQTRRRLIAAARRLFHARGFDQVTAEQIAAEAGVAKGTLFLHARTKERLLLLMFEEGLTEAVGGALRRARPDRPVVSTLTSVFRQFFRFYEARPELSRRFLREIAMLREPETEVMARLRLDLSTGLAAVFTLAAAVLHVEVGDWPLVARAMRAEGADYRNPYPAERFNTTGQAGRLQQGLVDAADEVPRCRATGSPHRVGLRPRGQVPRASEHAVHAVLPGGHRAVPVPSRAVRREAGFSGPLHQCSVYGSTKAGDKLNAMLEMGQSRPWPEALEKLTGEKRMDATAMLDFFAPLKSWLDEQNKGQVCGW